MKTYKTKPHYCSKFLDRRGFPEPIRLIYNKEGKKMLEGRIAQCPYCLEEYKIQF
jgi:hypothetical protein